jgi:hypothetical protein
MAGITSKYLFAVGILPQWKKSAVRLLPRKSTNKINAIWTWDVGWHLNEEQ